MLITVIAHCVAIAMTMSLLKLLFVLVEEVVPLTGFLTGLKAKLNALAVYVGLIMLTQVDSFGPWIAFLLLFLASITCFAVAVFLWVVEKVLQIVDEVNE